MARAMLVDDRRAAADVGQRRRGPVQLGGAHLWSYRRTLPTPSASIRAPRTGESVRPGPARLTSHAVTYRIGVGEGPPQVLRSRRAGTGGRGGRARRGVGRPT